MVTQQQLRLRQQQLRQPRKVTSSRSRVRSSSSSVNKTSSSSTTSSQEAEELLSRLPLRSNPDKVPVPSNDLEVIERAIELAKVRQSQNVGRPEYIGYDTIIKALTRQAGKVRVAEIAGVSVGELVSRENTSLARERAVAKRLEDARVEAEKRAFESGRTLQSGVQSTLDGRQLVVVEGKKAESAGAFVRQLEGGVFAPGRLSSRNVNVVGGGVDESRNFSDKNFVSSVIPNERYMGLQILQNKEIAKHVVRDSLLSPVIDYNPSFTRYKDFVDKQREIGGRFLAYEESPVGRIGSFDGDVVLPRDPSGKPIGVVNNDFSPSFLQETGGIVLKELVQTPFFAGALLAGGVESGVNVVKNVSNPLVRSSLLSGVVRAAKATPSVVGGFFSDVLPGGKPITPRATATTVELAIPFSPRIAKKVSSLFSPETISASTASRSVVARTFGLEAGSRSLPLFTIGRVDTIPEVITDFTRTPVRVSGDRSVVVSDLVVPQSSSSFFRFGARVPEPVSPSRVVGSGVGDTSGIVPVAQSALGGRLFRSFFDFSAAERERIGFGADVIRSGFAERGLKVKDAFFPVRGISDQKSFSKVVAEEFAKENALLFGSATTRQLRVGFRPSEIGDVEFFVPSGKQAGFAAARRVVSRSKEFGQPLFFDEAAGSLSTVRGDKVLEIKAPDLVDGEFSGIGVLGFPFSNLKSGSIIDQSVAFGPLRAERAGVQLARKGAGSLFVLGESFFSTSRGVQIPSEFQFAGLGAKRFKDLPDFIIQSSGIQDVQRLRSFGFSPKAARGERALAGFISTFSPVQRDVLQSAIAERVGAGNRVFIGELVSSPSSSVSPLLFSSSFSPVVSSPSSFVSSSSPSLSPRSSFVARSSASPVRSASLSPSLSPRRSVSPSRATSVFSISPSPSLSPRSSFVARSYPSPSITSSPSPSLTPSPSPSITSSPSPSLTPSPSITLRPPIKPPTSITPRDETFVSKSKRPSSPSANRVAEFAVFLKEKGRFRKIGLGTESEAKRQGSRAAKSSLAATFKVVATGRSLSSARRDNALPDLSDFREFKIRKGERVSTPGTFVQKRSKRLSSSSERLAIQRARKNKGFFSNKKFKGVL